MTANTTPAPPGWYPDPSAPGAVRWFDGVRWTQHSAPAAPAWAVPAQPSGLGENPSDPVHWLVPTGRSWQSIAAGYVALFATVIWVLGPVALGLGVWALRAAGRTGSHGRGRAWFAIVAGALASVALAVTTANLLTAG